MGKKWTKEAVELLKDNNSKSLEELSKLLNRTKDSIRKEREKLGLKNGNKMWIEDEIKILETNKERTIEELSKLLNRTKYSINTKLIELGLRVKNNKKEWSEEEVKILLENWEKPLKYIVDLLNRSIFSVKGERKKLGLKKFTPNVTEWADGEVEILKNNNNKTARELSIMLNRSKSSIKRQRSKLGLKKRTNVNKWTNEEIEILKKYGSSSYSKELFEKLLGKHTKDSIKGKLKELKIFRTLEFMGMKNKDFASLPRVPVYKSDQNITIDDLNNTDYQILIGSLLGDGCVKSQSKYKKSYIFSEGHGIKQENYLLWKNQMLKIFYPGGLSYYLDNVSFVTTSHPIFKLLRKEFYNESENRKAFIPLKYIERLDELGLLTWYLDDGSKGGKYSPGIVSCLFTKDDLIKSVNIINKNLNLSLYVREIKTDPEELPKKIIYFNAENRDKIIPIWQDLFYKYKMPDCMLYKITKNEKLFKLFRYWDSLS